MGPGLKTGKKTETSGLATCTVRATISVVGGKWKPLIILVLQSESLRFGVLLRRIPNASRKVLTDQLRDLERAKIVSRVVLGCQRRSWRQRQAARSSLR